jgi:aldose 1-epimerase
MSQKSSLLIVVLAVFALTSCCNKKVKEVEEASQSGLLFSAFKGEIDGKENNLYIMKNANGMEVCVINYGARIVSVLVPDKTGGMQDVVLGFDNISDFLNNNNNFGAAIGRYGNRIAKGKFKLDGVEYQLTINNGENSLHGGITGFQDQMFDIIQVDSATLECQYLSPDGDNGYPGNLNVKVIYKLTNDNAIDISYEAETDKPTVVNLTNHSYFNLSGNPNNITVDHILFMNCDNYTPVDAELIPTGEIATVKNTPMDFTQPTIIGERIDDYTFDQLKLGGGYDHNWIFNAQGDINTLACKAFCPLTGIFLEVYTIEPGVQFYAGNFLDGTLTGKKGIVYNKRAAFCLETQHYPDSPNQPNFPGTVLRPGEKYVSRCIYKFGVSND